MIGAVPWERNLERDGTVNNCEITAESAAQWQPVEPASDDTSPLPWKPRVPCSALVGAVQHGVLGVAAWCAVRPGVAPLDPHDAPSLEVLELLGVQQVDLRTPAPEEQQGRGDGDARSSRLATSYSSTQLPSTPSSGVGSSIGR